MPGLITSSLSTKATAPKAPPRRRPPPQAAKPAPAPVNVAPSIAPPDSLPETQQVNSTAQSVAQPDTAPGASAELEHNPASIPTSEPSQASGAPATQPPTEDYAGAPQSTNHLATTTSDDVDKPAKSAKVGSKRTHSEDAAAATKPRAKRAKKGSAQNNAEVQAVAQGQSEDATTAQASRQDAAAPKRVRVEDNTAPAAPRAKRVKKSSTGSNAHAQVPLQNDLENVTTAQGQSQAATTTQGQTEDVTTTQGQSEAVTTTLGDPGRVTMAQLAGTAKNPKLRATSVTKDGSRFDDHPMDPRGKKGTTVVDAEEGDEYQLSGGSGAGSPTAGDDGSAAKASSAATARKKKPQTSRKRRVKTAKSPGHGEDAGLDGEPQQVDGGPDSAEEHEIDPENLTMLALARDSYHGKRSEREKIMATLPWDEINRKRREKQEDEVKSQSMTPLHGIVPSTEGPDGAADARVPPELLDTNTQHPSQVRFILNENGEIVADEDSLRVDRDAGALLAANDDQTAVEDIDLTRRINRATRQNANRRDPAERKPRRRNDPWGDVETERFFAALSTYGTDFGIISHLFPGKTRHTIKLKFLAEERRDRKRIDDILLGKVRIPINLADFARDAGRDLAEFEKYDSLEHAQSVIGASLATRKSELGEAKRQEEAAAAEKEKLRRQKGAGRKKGKKNAEPSLFGSAGGIEVDVDAQQAE